MESDNQFKNTLEQDPGNEVFCEYADMLRHEGRHHEALDVCLAGLSVNPSCHQGRLLLARIFYERGFTAFSARELKELVNALPDQKFLTRLVEEIAPEMLSNCEEKSTEQEELAEVDVEIDMLLEDK